MKRQGASGCPLTPAPCLSARPLSTYKRKPNPPVSVNRPRKPAPELAASELTILNTHAALQELVVRAAASRTPLFARYDAAGNGLWIHKASRSDAVLHPLAVSIPVLNELNDLDEKLQVHAQADALIGHWEYDLVTGEKGVRIQSCLDDEASQDSPAQTILKYMARLASNPVHATEMIEADRDGQSCVLLNCLRAIQGSCEVTAALGAEVIANLLRHEIPQVLEAVHRTPEMLESLKGLCGAVRANCQHLGHNTAAVALRIISDNGPWPYPPPSIHQVVAADEMHHENECLARENAELIEQNQLLEGSIFQAEISIELERFCERNLYDSHLDSNLRELARIQHLVNDVPREFASSD